MTYSTAATLPGVNAAPYQARAEEVAAARERERVLLREGAAFGDEHPVRVPWLSGIEPFVLGRCAYERIVRLGAAVFHYVDAVQRLYAEGEPTVRQHLDINVPEAVRGLQLDRQMVTARFDLVMRGGSPVVTEVEEVYGNVGKLHAMQRAYGTDYDALFEAFSKLGLSHVFVDDSVRNYLPELRTLQRRLKESFGQSVGVAYFSDFRPGQRGTVWRFCYTKDLGQYPPAHQRAIAGSSCDFINPLFHGYGTKALLALAFHPSLAEEVSARLGSVHYSVLLRGLPHSRLIDEAPPRQFVERLLSDHKTSVLKVVDCSEDTKYTWGSRGVFFGDKSATRWRKAVEAALDGRIPGRQGPSGARFMVSELVESDRFDVRFWDAEAGRIMLMPRARARISPIFFRDERGVRLVGGHATFVNTSRKVHLGSHAVCTPLDWERNAASGRPPSPENDARQSYAGQ